MSDDRIIDFNELKNKVKETATSGKITESQMSQMNYQVGVEGKPAAKVAREFLVKEGIIRN